MTSPMERLKNKITKEVLWLYILRLLRERPMYAYELKERIKEAFNFEPATVSSYVVLYKLEKDGYVTAEWQESETGKPSRKYYRLTPEGEKLLKEGIAFLEQMLLKLKE
ncbi:transcription regulator, PadR-like family [Thermococcus onnurineus NA1]|uniref:Transcription regulator, PadR-like family n=1 Tax=Thermococcus onnurineus (strain NA1) TaxID=523850 RepID=B6YSR2_THEON|nr:MULTISPECIES: PadR family transcriptional regulator [Thermococcus]ACJ15599.1 transcription regulator, PadR-like family [Thermococcus onnurineus NA1]NJE00030.1 PadR family transcriptional regulator [Thermococcus sp. LS1]NJE47065.1 PadR family transcriptional regulator [Thermococcus sp. GR7]NJE78110.1 PadR family transcriptional regulator [Thermococcus sp. GR4]NJF22773.1 PadR family transcriptional regulator [Thermococcus sp. GR5]